MFLPNLLQYRVGRLIAFFLLYLTEGIPVGFTATAVATQMRRQGLTPAQIGMFVGALYLPWGWKWMMGPVVDLAYSRRLGRRRGWILGMHLLMSVGLVALATIPFAAHLLLFTAAVMVINFCSATQDVAIDALAFGVLSEPERGLANGMMFAGAYAGNALGGSVLFLTGFMPFSSTFVLVAAGILAVTVLVVLPMREPVPAAIDDDPKNQRIATRIRDYAREALHAMFGTRPAIAGLLFALLPAGAYGMSLALQSNLAVELGLSDYRIGQLSLVCSIISAGACIVGGYLSDLIGRRIVLGTFLAATAIPTAWLALVMQRHGWIMPHSAAQVGHVLAPASLLRAFWVSNILYALFQGLMYGTRTAAFMDICNPKVIATQFTAYMALLNVVIWYSSTWQGWAIQRWGYPTTLIADADFGLLCLAVLLFMTRRSPAPAAAAEERLIAEAR